MKGIVICDGRGNRGTGACAAVAYVGGEEVARRASKLDPVTNIVAEHRAIQLAIQLARDNEISELLILNDSQTPVYQLDGSYKVRADHLLPIVLQTWEMANDPFFISTDIRWVSREQTTLPDKLCRFVDSNVIPDDLTMQEFGGLPDAQKQISRRKRREAAAKARKMRPNPFVEELRPRSSPFSFQP